MRALLPPRQSLSPPLRPISRVSWETPSSFTSIAQTRCSSLTDFNGLPNEEARTEFYQHEAHSSNRMILG